MNSHPCSVCGEGGHHARRCPTLASPLTPGFYAPPAGHRPSNDDDDESLDKSRCVGVQKFHWQVSPLPHSVSWWASTQTSTGVYYLSATSFPLCNSLNLISGTI